MDSIYVCYNRVQAFLLINVECWDGTDSCDRKRLLLNFSVSLRNYMTHFWLFFLRLNMLLVAIWSYDIRRKSNTYGSCYLNAIDRMVRIPLHHHSIVTAKLAQSHDYDKERADHDQERIQAETQTSKVVLD